MRAGDCCHLLTTKRGANASRTKHGLRGPPWPSHVLRVKVLSSSQWSGRSNIHPAALYPPPLFPHPDAIE
jgi:hypothetical protein